MARLVVKDEYVVSPRHSYTVQLGTFEVALADGGKWEAEEYDIRVIPLGRGYNESPYIFSAETLAVCLAEFPDTVKMVQAGCCDP